jgi:DNA-dependent protein kinase catalytic subunit
VKSLLKRLYSLAHHPSPYKRLGSALTFQHIYRILRQEPSLVDVFALEALHNNLFSLRLAHSDDASLGTADKLSSVIGGLSRVVIRYADVLLKSSKQRRLHPDLRHFVNWLFQVRDLL